MVTTIDGKTITGTREDNVLDLGSKVDHELMDRIESASDAIILGAGSARANPASWDPRCPIRIVVTNSGEVDWDSKYFTGGQAHVACSTSADFQVPPHVTKLAFGVPDLDFRALVRHLRQSLDIQYLHCLGGSELNSQFLRRDLVDELFMTIAPKVKLGRNLPTYAGGEPLDRKSLLNFNLVEHHAVGDEVFLRYRRETNAN